MPLPSTDQAAGGARTLRGFLDEVAARGGVPAIIAVRGDTLETWSCAELAATADRLAAGLIASGLGRGETVALLGPSSRQWIACWFAIVGAGALAVPIDDRSGAGDLARIVVDSGCRWIFAARSHLAALQAIDGARDRRIVLLDDDAAEGPQQGWRSLLADSSDGLPEPDPAEPVSLHYTSGTTGAPKAVPLTHRNLMANLAGLLKAGLAGAGDRVLVPLPLHHAYPFTVGVLGVLGSGAAVILPSGISGPQIVQAIRAADASVMIGVPRLYEALLAGIVAKATSGGSLPAAAFARLLSLSVWLRRRFGLRAGRLLFRRLHAGLGPRLGLLSSGGAHLEEPVAWRLEGLGWEVLTGYGLTETAPILAFNPRGRARFGSAGLAIEGVELRIAAQPGSAAGEIQARGPNVFAGYRNNPQATRDAFTPDGWFRTGDLGTLDAEGYLHIVGRLKELIVLPDGKNVQPADVEAEYARSPIIREIAVLERGGILVGLIVPDPEAIRARGAARAESLLRDSIEAQSARLAPYQRLAGYAIAPEPLPRTHLGKLRRHLLPEIYERAAAGRGPAAPVELTSADRALLERAPAGAVWRWLLERYPDKGLTLESSPQLDLGIDSLAWVTLTLELQERFGVALTDTAVARVITLRDLLHEVVADAEAGPPPSLAGPPPAQLEPPGPVLRAVGMALFGLNRVVLRTLFDLRVEGAERVPTHGAVVLTPNHTSFLDGFALAGALPVGQVRRTWWAGWTGILFAGPFTRLFSRVVQAVPVDPDREPRAALARGAGVLARGRILVWFPEGRRSPTGALLPFLPGVGTLLAESGAVAVPVRIEGTFAAWPVGRKWPRRAPVAVTFGAPVPAVDLLAAGAGETPAIRIAHALHDAVARLGRA